MSDRAFAARPFNSIDSDPRPFGSEPPPVPMPLLDALLARGGEFETTLTRERADAPQAAVIERFLRLSRAAQRARKEMLAGQNIGRTGTSRAATVPGWNDADQIAAHGCV